jgi:predicted dehydrogenase
MTGLRVGVVGLGEVAQIIHLPNLNDLGQRFEISAVCDVSPGVLKAVAHKYHVAHVFMDYAEMLRQVPLDVVFVLNANEYHAPTALAAMDHGVNVFVEKPLCMNRREAEALQEKAQSTGLTLMVGYMRRYDQAFSAALEIVAGWPRIDYAEIFDIIGSNRLIIDQAAEVFRFNDVPAAFTEERWARHHAAVADALGSVPRELENAYGMMLGLASHDVSAMREMLGRPQRVLAAKAWNGGSYFHAMLDFGSYVGALQIGADEQLRFDAHLLLTSPKETLRLQYDTPYIRHLPTQLFRDVAANEVWTRTQERRSFRDSFVAELQVLYQAVTERAEVKTSAADFVHDLVLFETLIQTMKASL